jgi:hypothetical protein
MKTEVGVFEGLKERFCAIECGCFPMSSEVFESLLSEEK